MAGHLMAEVSNLRQTNLTKLGLVLCIYCFQVNGITTLQGQGGSISFVNLVIANNPGLPQSYPIGLLNAFFFPELFSPGK